MIKSKSFKKIVVLDFWSEKNRGDAAMQISLIRLLHKYFPNSELIVFTAFGTNEDFSINEHFEYTLRENVKILKGIQPTLFMSEKELVRKSKIKRILIELYYILISLFLIFISYLKLTVLIPRNLKEAFTQLLEADIVI